MVNLSLNVLIKKEYIVFMEIVLLLHKLQNQSSLVCTVYSDQTDQTPELTACSKQNFIALQTITNSFNQQLKLKLHAQ